MDAVWGTVWPAVPRPRAPLHAASQKTYPLRAPQDGPGSQERTRRNEWEVQRNESLWGISRSVGQAEGLADDVGAGEDVAFAHQEASAHDPAISGTDAHE